MNIHEYQAKELLKRYGVPVPLGKVVSTPQEARGAAVELGGRCVVKAQIHAGGRGKAGGVKLARDPADAEKKAAEILGKNLVTHQTGPEGRQVRKVLIEQGLNIDRELYLGMVLDRAQSRIAVICSAEGGVEIEEVAAKNPEKILKELIDPAVGLLPFQCRKLAFALGMPAESVGKLTAMMQALYRAFDECDCSLAEINPLVLTKEGQVIALDAKMNVDSNAFFRQKEILALRDLHEEELAAPHLIDLEVSSGLRQRVLRTELGARRADEALRDFSDLPLIRYPATELMPRIWALVATRTSYDAAYVVLGERPA